MNTELDQTSAQPDDLLAPLNWFAKQVGSRRTAYEILNAKKVIAKKRGRRTFVVVESARAYIASLPDYEPQTVKAA